MPGPSTCRVESHFDATTVHVDQVPDDGESNAQPALRPVERTVALFEQVEQSRHDLWIDTLPLVAHRQHGAVRINAHADVDVLAIRRVLGCVGEQIRGHLAKSHDIPVDAHLRLQHFRRHDLTARLDLRQHGFERRGHHVLETHHFAPQLDAAVGDARHVEQVVDQVREMAGLAFQHLAGALHRGLVRWIAAQDVGYVTDGGERIAQLVREHGQELVLAPVVLQQRGGRSLGRARALVRASDGGLQRVHDECREHGQQQKEGDVRGPLPRRRVMRPIREPESGQYRRDDGREQRRSATT
jgi:hypothetical protein